MRERLAELLAEQRVRELTVAERTELNALLRKSPEARQFAARFLLDDAALEEALRTEQVERLMADEAAPVALVDATVPRHSRSWWSSPMLAAAAVVVLLGIIVWVNPFARDRQELAERSPALTNAVPQIPAVAVLSRTVNAQWDGASTNLSEGTELAIGSLQLRSGTVQLDFFSGARLVIVGPAELEIRAERTAHLARGIATCEVDERGRGFQLSAPGLQVVDLGTAFGLRVLDVARPEVQVLDGKVGVALAGGGRFTELGKGQSLQLASGAFVPTEFTPEKFPRSTDLRRSEVVETARRFSAWQQQAAALDRDPSVLAHFTFDNPEADYGGSARNLATSPERGTDGMVIGARKTEGRWPDKHALEFRGRGDRVLLRVPGAHSSLTYGAWVRVDAYQQGVTALLVTEGARRWQGLDGGATAVALTETPYTPLRWELRDDGQLALNWQRSAKVDGKSWHIHWADAALPADRLGAWTFLAAVVDGERGEVIHYVNGREVARHPAKIETPFALTRMSLGNLSSTDAEAKAGIRYGFYGLMDEVFVASRAFKTEEIQRLHNAGRP